MEQTQGKIEDERGMIESWVVEILDIDIRRPILDCFRGIELPLLRSIADFAYKLLKKLDPRQWFKEREIPERIIEVAMDLSIKFKLIIGLHREDKIGMFREAISSLVLEIGKISQEMADQFHSICSSLGNHQIGFLLVFIANCFSLVVTNKPEELDSIFALAAPLFGSE